MRGSVLAKEMYITSVKSTVPRKLMSRVGWVVVQMALDRLLVEQLLNYFTEDVDFARFLFHSFSEGNMAFVISEGERNVGYGSLVTNGVGHVYCSRQSSLLITTY